MKSGIEASAVLRLLPARPRLLALGEPTHGSEVLLDLRNDLFRQLAEQGIYRTIALESDAVRGRIVDEYVTSGTGTLDDVLERGLSHEWGAHAGNRELVRWMRSFNDGRPRAEQVRFAGFDGPLEITGAEGPRPTLTALHAYLATRADADLLPCDAATLDRLLGPDDHWTNPAAMRDPSQSIGRTPAAKELRLIADDLTTLLGPHTDELALLNARTAAGLLRYHYWMADTSPARLAWLLTVRDSVMAANLLALTDQGPVFAYAQNGHLQRHRSSMQMGGRRQEWWSAGAIASAKLGPEYAFVATAIGTFRHHGVDVPPPTTIEGLLYAQPEDVSVGKPVAAPDTRVSSWFGYSPLDPTQVAAIDGIVFVKDL